MTRVLPHDSAAERHVLGACLLGSEFWPIVADALTESDFYEPRHQLIYASLSRLARSGDAMDSISLRSALDAVGFLSAAGGDEYLMTIQDTIPMPGHVERHCERIRELSTVRDVYAAASSIASEALEHIEDVGDFLDRAETALSKAAERRRNANEPVHIDQAATAYFEALTKRAENNGIVGHTTGLYLLDHYLAGLAAGEMIVTAGRPGTGKTAFALNVAVGVARSSKLPVLFFSVEMPTEQLMQRALSAEAGVDGMKLRRATLSRQDWVPMTRAAGELGELGVYIEDSSNMSILDVRRVARKLKRRCGGLALVVIDYLQLLRPVQRGRANEEEIQETSRLTKALAKELKVPVLALAQLNRESEKRGKDKRPQMSDLRGSGSIEQDADTILLLYRDEVYNAQSEEKGIAEVIIEKQRMGATGTLKFAFRKEFTRFENLETRYDAGEHHGYEDRRYGNDDD